MKTLCKTQLSADALFPFLCSSFAQNSCLFGTHKTSLWDWRWSKVNDRLQENEILPRLQQAAGDYAPNGVIIKRLRILPQRSILFNHLDTRNIQKSFNMKKETNTGTECMFQKYQASSVLPRTTISRLLKKMTDILELRGHLLKQDRKDNHASQPFAEVNSEEGRDRGAILRGNEWIKRRDATIQTKHCTWYSSRRVQARRCCKKRSVGYSRRLWCPPNRNTREIISFFVPSVSRQPGIKSSLHKGDAEQ